MDDPQPENQELFEQIQQGNTQRGLNELEISNEEEDDSGKESDSSSGEEEEDEEDYDGDSDGSSNESDEGDTENADAGDTENADADGEFEHYVPVSLGNKLQRQHGVPQDWTRCTEIPGTGESVHILCPNNFVFTKKEESFKKGDSFHGWKLRCQESRRGKRSCNVTWLVHCHPEEIATRGEHQPLYYKDDEVPTAEAHDHLPDIENVVKR